MNTLPWGRGEFVGALMAGATAVEGPPENNSVLLSYRENPPQAAQLS